MTDCDILHITTVHPVLDDRILYKECVTLKDQGYKVCLLVVNPGHVSVDGIKILGLPAFTSRLARLFKGSWLAYREAKRSKARLIHFHDPELMVMAVLLRLAGKKVVYDVHENIAQQIRYKPWIKPSALRWVISGLVHTLEQFCCLFYQGIAAATEDIARKFPPSKTIVLRNFPLARWAGAVEGGKSNAGPKILVYAGGLTRIRGIKEMIVALEKVQFPCILKLIGKFDEPAYEQECRCLSGWTKVDYRGFMPLDKVYREIASSDIGIALLYPATNYLRSLPVKAFEYMAFGLPMLLSDFPYWKEYFEGCAVFANPLDTTEIAEKLDKLLADQDLREMLGRNGKLKIQQEYSWEAESHRLLDLYKKLTHED